MERAVKKILTDIQLEVQLSKFDSREEGGECPQQIFECQLKKFVLAPFGDRLMTYISYIFSELNLDDKILKDFNQARKQKKQSRKNQNSTSASKRTPTRVHQTDLSTSEFLKSPLRKRKTSQVATKETQTDFQEPCVELTNQNSKPEQEPLLCQKPVA